jgi:hypothetical protein
MMKPLPSFLPVLLAGVIAVPSAADADDEDYAGRLLELERKWGFEVSQPLERHSI